jgi:hypothetical protein
LTPAAVTVGETGANDPDGEEGVAVDDAAGSSHDDLGSNVGPNQRLWQSLLDAVVFVDLVTDLIDIDVPLDPVELERLADRVEAHADLDEGDARRVARALRHLAWIESTRTRR